MAEEVGIVMSLYDRVSPTLKAIAGNSQAFDKTLDDLEESIRSYDKAQDSMVKKYADLKKAMAETDNQVKAAQKSYKKLNDEASKKALAEAIDRQAELRRALAETETNLKANSKAYDDLYEQTVVPIIPVGHAESGAGDLWEAYGTVRMELVPLEEEATDAPQSANMVGPMMPKQTEKVRGHVVITVAGRQYGDPIPMDRDKIITVKQENGAINRIHITPEYVEMESSTCENQDCIGEGEVNVNTYKDRILSTYIICLPNQVTIEMVPADE